MKPYGEFRPTGFDRAGLNLPDRQDWLVGPVGTNRDADTLQRSNWAVVTEDLARFGDDVEVHEFGHWACGWLRVVLIRPGTEAARCAEGWESALSDYPVASDNHFSDLEHQETIEYWQGMRPGERAEALRKAGLSGRAWRAASPPDRVYDRLRDVLI